MSNRKTVEIWGFNKLGLECDEYDKVNLICRKTCRKYSSSNNEVASSSNLIKTQVDRFITGMAVIKSNNFSDYVTKSVSHLNTVNSEWFKSAFGDTFRSNLYCQLCERNESKLERPACY